MSILVNSVFKFHSSLERKSRLTILQKLELP
jgi:hypothetical protein